MASIARGEVLFPLALAAAMAAAASDEALCGELKSTGSDMVDMVAAAEAAATAAADSAAEKADSAVPPDEREF